MAETTDKDQEIQAEPKRKRGRPRKTTTSATAATPKPGPVRRRGRTSWATLVKDISEEHIVDYSISADFSETEAIRHKKFGVGVITKILDDNKIEVVFEEEKKVLAQNWE